MGRHEIRDGSETKEAPDCTMDDRRKTQMNADRKSLLKEQFLDEIWDEISSQRGKELDEYLADIGLNPDNLLQMYEKGLDIAFTAAKRVRFEEARRSVRARAASGIAKIAAFDLAKKKQIMAAIR